MPRGGHSSLVLGLGNDILGDDAVGLLAARALREEFQNRVDVAEAAVSGLELLEILEGYHKVLILDAVVTHKHPTGTIFEVSKEQFGNAVAISPHYMGLPEVFQLAEKMKITFPKEIRILVMEIESPFELRESLTEPVRKAFPGFIQQAKDIINISFHSS